MAKAKKNSGGRGFVQFPQNPRSISPQELLQLGESMGELGSLDGIVVNLSEGKYHNAVICGNQKSEHIDLNKATIVRDLVYETPTAAGTTSTGYVEYKGERFPYREVIWSERKCEVANLRGNNAGGHNNAELLALLPEEVLIEGGINLLLEERLEELRDNMSAPDISNYTQGGDDDNKPQDPKKPKAKKTDDEYSGFDIMMLHTDKLVLVETLNKVRQREGHESLADSLVFILNNFKSNYEL